MKDNQNNIEESSSKSTNQNFFVGSVPQNYDRYMGPLLLDPFAKDITERIKIGSKLKVLELAAGTGRVTQPLLKTLPDAKIIASDISEDMMDVAKAKIKFQNVLWQNCNMDTIPYPEDSFDLIICQFGVMFVQDKQKAFHQMYRALKPGGQLLFNTWGDLTKNPIWRINFQIYTETFGQSPLPPELGPFALTNTQTVMEYLETAKFKDITATEVHKIAQIDTAALAADAFLNIQPNVTQRPELYPELHSKLTFELAKQLGNNPLESPLLALVFEATK